MLPLNQVSLIIPTYNRQEIVFQTLQYITGQSISGFEVIIVDQTIEKDSNLENFKNWFSFQFTPTRILVERRFNTRALGSMMIFLRVKGEQGGEEEF